MEKIVRERLRISVQPAVVVRDIASVVFAGLVQVNVAIDTDQKLMETLMDGIYQILVRVVSGKKIYGTVNLAIFDALSSLAPRVVEIAPGMTVALSVDLEDYINNDIFYRPSLTTDNAMSEFFQAQQTIGGVLIDLQQMGEGKHYKLPSGEEVIPGATMGALNFNATESVGPLFRIRELGSFNTSTSHWLRQLTWASAFTGQGFFPTRTSVINFPNFDVQTKNVPVNSWHITPGTIILARAMLNPAIMAGRSFTYPCYFVPDVCKYLSEDYSRRLGKFIPPEQLLDAAMAALARVAVQSGQVSYIGMLPYANRYHLPEAIVESLLARASVRSNRVALPWVMSGHFSLDANLPTTYEMVAYDMGKDLNIHGPPEMFTFQTISAGAIIAAGGKVAPTEWIQGWNKPPAITSGDYQKPGLLVDTIGRGGLSAPGEDRSCGRWNPADTVRVAITSQSTTGSNVYAVFGNSKILSYTSVVSDECVIRMVGKMCIPFTYLALFPTGAKNYEFKLYDSPVSAALDGGNCWDKYVVAAVSESGSAKYTALQELLNQLNKSGAGADSLLGKMLRSGGGLASYVAPALGYPVVGTVVDLVANKVADVLTIADKKDRKSVV